MGFWDFLKRGDNKSDKLGHKPAPLRKEVARWADKAADKRAQNYDRQEAIAALADLCQPLTDEAELAKTDKGKIQLEEHGAAQIEAATALFKRFNFVMDPSITDQEEKQLAFDGIMGAGKGILIPLRAYAAGPYASSRPCSTRTRSSPSCSSGCPSGTPSTRSSSTPRSSSSPSSRSTRTPPFARPSPRS